MMYLVASLVVGFIAGALLWPEFDAWTMRGGPSMMLEDYVPQPKKSGWDKMTRWATTATWVWFTAMFVAAFVMGLLCVLGYV